MHNSKEPTPDTHRANICTITYNCLQLFCNCSFRLTTTGNNAFSNSARNQDNLHIFHHIPHQLILQYTRLYTSVNLCFISLSCVTELHLEVGKGCVEISLLLAAVYLIGGGGGLNGGGRSIRCFIICFL